ncbi:CapA family protein [Kribbella sp. VKM Ac-2568]|uniref:CapA family protein n=1 Tax=Kribbella sp. VKM Ac-2568 TaxID=2512219 RepID=UPI0010540516|nr:CapA family protein [Kribbella sp. VKM Ac-2568]TCM49977.1 poly-gamma-glutamate synthesis protein (capsule biosynthesis protein) [Kribbella sp. VKM Ac-2568]
MLDGTVTLFLGGDVMLGRGVDQILPYPGDPTLCERSVRDARTYVELAEAVNGPIPRPVGYSWPWGDALVILDRLRPDVRLVNLETSVTRSEHFATGKGVHYRMSPDNLPALSAARPDVCSLANNHVLDFGISGLEETLDVLSRARISVAGAGRDAKEAAQPVIVPGDGGRVVVFSFGTTSSGVPRSWAASANRPGISLLPDLSDDTAAAITAQVSRVKRRGDVVIASVHWGPNWTYAVAPRQVRFAHRLVDGGVDLVHGHSAHHPQPIEIYRDRLVLYGCGDLIDDYEGIAGYEQYRDDLRLLYFATVERQTGRLTALRMALMQTRQLRLRTAAPKDCLWMCQTLNRLGRGTGIALDAIGLLELTDRSPWSLG